MDKELGSAVIVANVFRDALQKPEFIEWPEEDVSQKLEILEEMIAMTTGGASVRRGA